MIKHGGEMMKHGGEMIKHGGEMMKQRDAAALALPWAPHANDLRWGSNRHRIIGDVILDERMRAYHRVAADLNAVKNRHPCSEPCMLADGDASAKVHGSRNERSALFPFLVIARADIAVRSKQHALPDLNARVGRNPAVRSDVASSP